MAGRPSKPTELIMLEGNKDHRTKAELNARREAEKALYTGEHFTELKQVKANKIAHAEFLRLKRLFGKITFVDALDHQIINRYCLEVANTYKLQEIIEHLNNELDGDIEFEDRMKIYDQLNKTMAAQDKNKKMLLKYEDRLFLNPAGRVRSIPKKPDQEKTPTGMAAFIKKRADG